MKTRTFMQDGNGYMAIQRTRPQTPAFALNDSPVGLAAWLVEKRYAWADCRDGLEAVFSKNDLLDTVMIYWLTETYVSLARYYYEARSGMRVRSTTACRDRGAERYYNLKRWNVADKGGHFAPMETLALMVDDTQAFFRELRS